jgi:hypothetical protein
MADKFVYSSEPRSVASNRNAAMYREPEDEDANIMHDRRVVRGNTYAAQVLTSTAQEEAERLREEDDGMQRKRLERERRRQQRQAPSTPPPPGGRKHIDVQTDNYLEELTDKVPEVEEETQTEAFMDRPPSPLFIPSKTGHDMATQIEPGDLFDFDMEVVPILEVLVGKTLEVSMMEVMEEEELATIRMHQENFEQTRNAELAEVQRLEAEAKRKFAEKQRRMKEQKERIAQQQELKEKVAARSFAKNYLSDLHSSVFSTLMDSGHFYDPLAKEVQESFMPWVMDQMVKQLDEIVVSQTLTDGLIREAMELSVEKQKKAAEQRRTDERKAAIAAKRQAEEDARRKEEEDRKKGDGGGEE